MTDSSDHQSEQTWDYARRYAATISTLPDQIKFAVKILLSDQTWGGAGEISNRSYSAVRLIDRLSAIKAPLYFAAYKLYPKRFSVAEDDTSKALLRILGPGLFASLLTHVWYYRRIKKLCHSSIWETFSQHYRLGLELGFRCGSAVPELGPAVGTMIGGIRYAGLAAMAIKNYEMYQRYVNSRGLKLDVEFEHSRWGCDHAQIGFSLLQSIGGMNWAGEENPNAFYPHQVRNALLGKVVNAEDTPEILQLWGAAINLIESFKEGRGSQEQLDGLSIDPTQEELLFCTLQTTVETKAAGFQWINRKQLRLSEDEDIPVPGQARAEQVTAAAADLNIPGFTKEELEGLSPEELEQLRAFAEES